MTTLSRRAADPGPFILGLVILALAAGCSPVASRTPAPSIASTSSASSPASATEQPSLTAGPGGPASPVVGATIGPPTTTTSTDFGEIWDALPPSFPAIPGQVPATTASGATSGSFAVPGDATTASATIRAALESQGWTVDVGSPLEDGSIVLEATGAREGCAAEVRFTPTSGTVVMSVRYGAKCPFG